MSQVKYQRLALAVIFFTVWLLLILRYAGGYQESPWPDSDTVIFSLMAMHLMQGEAFSWYFYGQDYMGTFPVLIIWGLFELWGISHLWVELFIAWVYAATITLVSGFIIRKSGVFPVWISAVLYCLFPTEMDVLTALDSGLHNFSIFTGLLCSYWFCRIWERQLMLLQGGSVARFPITLVVVMLLAVLTYWSSKLGMAYILPIVMLAIFSTRKQFKLRFWPASFATKTWLVHRATQFFSKWYWLVLICLSFAAFAIFDKALFNLKLIGEIYFIHLFEKVPSPWNTIWATIPLLSLAGILFNERKRLVSMLKGEETRLPWHLLILSVPFFNLLVALPTTEYLDDFTSTRYFESFQWAFLFVIPLFIAKIKSIQLIYFLSLAYLLIALLTWYSPEEEDYDRLSKPLQTLEFIAARKEDSLRLSENERQLIEFLTERQLYCGYGDYWLAYRLTYLTHEKFIISPHIESRYAPYDKKVEAQGVGFFVFEIYELADGREYASRRGMQQEKIFGELILFY